MPAAPNPRPRRPVPLVGQVTVTGSMSDAGSSSTTAVPLSPSLLTTLTKPATEGYPATEVIKFLIEVVGRDVVCFRRNTQLSYLLVDRARDICDAINVHIKKTESGSGTDTEWASFEKFSDAIDPVEDTLFKVTAFTEDEKISHIFKGDSVHECIASAENWATNREGVWNTLNLLETTTELTNLFSDVDISSRQAERVQAQIHDDKTFLGEVIEEIDHNFTSIPDLTVPPIVVKMIATLRELRDKISMGARAISPDLTVLTLKAGLIVQGVTKLAFHTDTLDYKIVGHLRSGAIWAAAAKLVELLNTTRDDGSARSMEKVRKRYDEFLKLLPDAKDLDVPKSYIELLKVAGQVRRPFHSQAVALISLCRRLVVEFSEKKKRTPDNLIPLEEALNATLKGVNDAVDAVTELKIFDLNNFEGHPAYQTLNEAREHIKKCHDSLSILGDWSQWELYITDAIKKDRERMGRLNKLLDTRPSLTAQERAEQIELSVGVFDTSSSRYVHQDTFPVEGSTRLSAVRWTIAGTLEESLKRRVRLGGQFAIHPDGTPCDLHETVSQFAGSSRKCMLRLAI